jgi:beta-xylosidase
MKSFHIYIIIAALAMLVAGCKATSLELGPNPFITHMYTADPSGHVWNDGRLYVYPSHDIDPPRGCDLMDQYHVFSSADLKHWTDHGEILRASQVPWGRPEGGFMWAPDCAYRNGKYYFYFPHPSESNVAPSWKIGVAVSDKPDRDFRVLDQPMQGVGGWDLIDPAVFVDDDGQAYFYYGGGSNCYGAPLNDDMISLKEPLRKMEGINDFHEAAWVHKYNGRYYLSYADNNENANRLQYAISDSPLGPWRSMGVFLGPQSCAMSHGSIVQFKGQWYVLYHCSDLSNGENALRSICIDRLEYNPDGTIRLVKQHR